MIRFLGLFAAMFALAPIGVQPSGTEPQPLMPWPMVDSREPFERLGTSGYLEAVLGLLDREEEAMASPEIKSLYLDILGTQLAFAGEHERATRRGDEAFPRTQPDPSDPAAKKSLLMEFEPVPAVDAIVNVARDRQLVMINEEHRSSQQRAFAHQLLGPLRDLGFTHLAVETLSEDPATLAARGYPVLKTGTYTVDPVFGDLIRRALDLGFGVIGYEAGRDAMMPRPDDTSPVDRMNRREKAQAVNIFERIFEHDPDARVLVYAGRDHIAESPAGEWVPMGHHLKQLSGIDPFSVNLFVMTEHSQRNYEHWAYRHLDAAGRLKDVPVVLRNEDGDFWSASPGSLDAYVFHPRTRFVRGRPDWMSMGGLRRPYEPMCDRLDEPVLIQALVNGESESAIPLDHAIWWPGEPKPFLFLRPGGYNIRVINRTGEVVHREEASVD